MIDRSKNSNLAQPLDKSWLKISNMILKTIKHFLFTFSKYFDTICFTVGSAIFFNVDWWIKMIACPIIIKLQDWHWSPMKDK